MALPAIQGVLQGGFGTLELGGSSEQALKNIKKGAGLEEKLA